MGRLLWIALLNFGVVAVQEKGQEQKHGRGQDPGSEYVNDVSGTRNDEHGVCPGLYPFVQPLFSQSDLWSLHLTPFLRVL